ncbi:isoaspartyl peptidase/L-asparaginase [Chitinimonas lacunae]|uniref:Isoaspartyl peptidase/L-asparaginase n=1 Tax=Chitinimonas lacunae TaxID=1963018 RepID=A0ABV8MRZ4_9NEIS
MAATIVTHGGTDMPPEEKDGCETAARLGLQKLGDRQDALEAVVTAVASLEADGRYDAGVGSLMGMDGKTLELDAAVMDSRGRLGAVAALQNVRHPVKVAQRITDTPHVLLVGQGAEEFARRIGLHSPFEPSVKAQRKFREYIAEMKKAHDDDEGAEDTEEDDGKTLVRKFWNFPTSWQAAVDRAGHGTVGAVARDEAGHFAVAVSTGGSPPALYGRVADTPLIGCGFYAGQHGAIACTGIGEHIVRNMLARTVYEWIISGTPLQAALERAIALLPQGIDIGLIGVTATEAHVAARKPMASAILAL